MMLEIVGHLRYEICPQAFIKRKGSGLYHVMGPHQHLELVLTLW